jgi:hypothetical protein
MDRLDIGDATVFVMANDPVGGFWNRTIGLGVTDPLTAEQLGQITSFATTAGAGLQVIQVAPGAQPLEWPDELAAIGAVPSATWVKFVGRPPLAYEGETSLRISKLGDGHEADYGRVMCMGFEMPLESPLPTWFEEVFHAPNWTPYGAFDGDELVAVASLWVDGDLAALCGAATLPSARGQGAQGALMGRRLADAWAAGAQHIGSETGSESPDHPNPSLHNMRRVGLTEAYTRTNYIWRAASS